MTWDQPQPGTQIAEPAGEPFPWLFAYFRQIYEMVPGARAFQMEALHYAYSRDGAHWTALNNNQPVFHSTIGNKSIRDPFVNRGQDGWFHLLTTNGASHDIFYARSRDLIDWEDVRLLPVMSSVAHTKNVWAPEFVYDPTRQDYFLVWTSTVSEKKGYPRENCIWCARTLDFQTFSAPRLLFDPGLNVIDANIVHSGNTYYMFFKPDSDNPTKFVRIATASSLEGPYRMVTEGITPAVTEGPAVVRRRDPDEWCLFYDHAYTNGYGLSVSQDLLTWRIVDDVSFPPNARHGSICPITEAELAALLERYG